MIFFLTEGAVYVVSHPDLLFLLYRLYLIIIIICSRININVKIIEEMIYCLHVRIFNCLIEPKRFKIIYIYILRLKKLLLY